MFYNSWISDTFDSFVKNTLIGLKDVFLTFRPSRWSNEQAHVQTLMKLNNSHKSVWNYEVLTKTSAMISELPRVFSMGTGWSSSACSYKQL